MIYSIPVRTSRLLQILCLIVSGFLAQSVYASDPTAPTGVRATMYSSISAEIFWNRSSDDGTVVGYDLTRNGRYLGTFDQLSYLARDLTTGKPYTFIVTAVDNRGNRSVPSTLRFIAGSPAGQTVMADTVAAPTGYRSIVYSNTAVEVFWDRVRGSVMEYLVYVNGKLEATTRGVSHFLEGLAPNRKHEIEVVAVDRSGNESEEVSLSVFTNASPTEYYYPIVPISQPQTPPTVTTPVQDVRPSNPQPSNPQPANYRVFAPAADDIITNRSRFQEDGYGTVDVLRVNLVTSTREGVCIKDNLSGCTLDDVLNDTDKRDDLKVDINVNFSADDFAYDGTENAELRQRGGGSRFGEQKSFRIKLNSKENLWRNERYLQLNKHPFESDRMRNKLAMDLMSTVPHLPSFRTQFVNLWIDDRDGRGPVDFGLFTHVERNNKAYLKSRGLDKDGNLYKAAGFRFSAEDLVNVRMNSAGEPANDILFDSVMEIEEGDDHSALGEMMAALHNPNQSFESVLDTYFNRNNVTAWMAANILLKQDDATKQNFMLYNPSGSKKFYFLPWDYDATMVRWTLPADNSYSNNDMHLRLRYGYALAHENFFIEQFYRLPGMHDQMLEAVNILRNNYMDDARITKLSEHNASLIEPFQMRSPDREHNPQYNGSPSFAQSIRLNAEAIKQHFNVPVPPTLLAPQRNGDSWDISWKPAYDLTGRGISYDLQIATRHTFQRNEIVVDIKGIADGSGTVSQRVSAAQLPGSTYYVRLIARSDRQPSRYWVPARDFVDINGTRFYGMTSFRTN